MPAAQGFGVVVAKGKLLHHTQARRLGSRTNARRAGQATARKDVLLDEISALHVALEQRVVNHDALDARAPAWFQQTRHAAKVAGPIGLAHGLDHLNRANGIERGILNIEVVLQAQIHLGGHTGRLHALLAPGQLFGGQCHARHLGLKLTGCHFGQRAPATANFQHALARLHTGAVQGAAHFGVLGLGQVTLQIALEPGAGVIHARVKPELVEIVAQVVVGVDVAAAARAGVAVEQVAQAVGQPPPPAAIDQRFERVAVGHQQAQQVGQVGGAPVLGDIALGQANVARAQHCSKHPPVVQTHAGVWVLATAQLQDLAIGQFQVQRAVLQALQQAQALACRSGHIGSQWERRR